VDERRLVDGRYQVTQGIDRHIRSLFLNSSAMSSPAGPLRPHSDRGDQDAT
jgi:hypothetical protein